MTQRRPTVCLGWLAVLAAFDAAQVTAAFGVRGLLTRVSSRAWSSLEAEGDRAERDLLHAFAGGALGNASAAASWRRPPGAFAVAGTNQTPGSAAPHLGQANGAAIVCGELVQAHPDSMTCPTACPFMRIDPTKVCNFQCVTADRCSADDPLFSYADPEVMRCGVCHVAACQSCGATARMCGTCQAGYELLEGKCYSKNRLYWWLFYGLCGSLVVLVVVYVVSLALRPVTNDDVLANALRFRDYTRTRRDADNRLFSWSTDVRNEYTSGVGVMLFFNGQYYVLWYGVVVLAVTSALAIYFSRRPAIMKARGGDTSDAFNACNADVRGQLEIVEDMEYVYFFAILGLYVFTTVAALVFSVLQTRFYNQKSLMLTTMQDYVLHATGLPKMPGTDNVEEELKAFFGAEFGNAGCEVVGVSPCWDYRKFSDEIDEQVRFDLDERERTWELKHFGQGNSLREKENDAAEARASTRLDFAGSGGTSPRKGSKEDSRCCGSLSCGKRCGVFVRDNLRSADALLGIGGSEDSDHIGPEDKGAREVQAMLETIRTSGSAFVVFKTEAQRDKAQEYLKDQVLVFRDHEIDFLVPDCEPETVLWAGYGQKDEHTYLNIFLGILVIFLSICLLDFFFYFPSVAYFISVSSVKGMTQGGFQGTILGMLVCVCNAIIYIIIGKVADWIRFDSVGSHQRFYVVSYTFAVFFNTVIDLWVVMLLAQGYTVDQATKMHAGGMDTSMSARAVLDNPTMQRVIYTQFVAYIFPSCLLLPFVAEPFVNQGLFQIFKWLVRSRTDISVQDAEIFLQCPQFDLARYGDILINLSLCLGTLAFTYRDLWWIFMCLVLSSVWLYYLDKWRLLRGSTKGAFVSNKMDVTAQWLAAFPCAIIACCLVFRMFGIAEMLLLQEVLAEIDGLGIGTFSRFARYLNKDIVSMAMFLAAALHCVFHFLALRWLVPRWSEVSAEGHDFEVAYESSASEVACNWFNSNPVHCLRSKYIHNHETPCVKFENGRNYLLLKNEELGLWYQREEPPENSKEVTMTTVFETAKTFRETTKAKTQAALRKIGSAFYATPPASPHAAGAGEEKAAAASSSEKASQPSEP
eukprot:TRINITY_DN81252_c0_g1_i1.p1 TRINITY_DN81252_c0_g1~~TRINITY_DN81252_c0_g1_i1.p1  ORF type:complete len:1089 (-),score=243.62 TRINITY_DN81252_c0_g1_i1:159-3425(-)